MSEDKPTILSISCAIPENKEKSFHDWQARLNTTASLIPGFISSEVSFVPKPDRLEWLIVQRFKNFQELNAWEGSSDFKARIKELEEYAEKGSIKCGESNVSGLLNGVTEIFVTEVSPGKEADFQRWNAKINQVESQFPGFRGAYLQSPQSIGGTHWITLIRFDTTENLDRWLASNERKDILKDSEMLVSSLEGHRIASPYAGWFASVSKPGKAPPGWKQGTLVLLVLYPIVMIELKYLGFLANYFNLSLRTFIANSISVALVTYPLIPIAIRNLNWWLNPPEGKEVEYTRKGCLLIAGFFLLEVIICSFFFN